VQGTGNFNPAVSWAASTGTITANGLYTAPTLTATTQVTITATSAQDSTKSGSTTITVQALLSVKPIPDIALDVLGRKITPVDLLLYVEGGTEPFTFAIASQTATLSMVASINGDQLVSDYGYYADTNVVNITVTDANQQTAQTTVRIVVSPPVVPYRLFAVDFSPYIGNQNPDAGAWVDEDQLIQQIGLLAPYVRGIRTLGCTGGLQNVPEIARRFGLSVYAGMWISSNLAANNTEVLNCITIAQTSGMDVAIVGSEALLRNDVTPAQLIAYINQFRASVSNIPVTTADVYWVLENNPEVVAASDVIYADFNPYSEGVDVTKAVAALHADYELLQATYAPKEVIVSETGWPSFGTGSGNAVPSSQNATSYFLNLISWAKKEQHKTEYFEAHDEPWKGADDGWGIWDSNLVMKPGMMDVFNGVTMADNWTCNAVPGGAGMPALQLTSVPAIGSSDLLKGQEWHAVPANYYVVVYIHVGSLGWWVKPYQPVV
jgi:exo-beta-1,3-glucanase (GH17 family)